ncbi:MAG: cytochrome c-type biogenesis CcmF C-terminal domain-containing protein, partial [Phenylobacterium sp.]|nr:cytochrome c-type biogenesis CcmF C-terminal domain-containing protein [Phenylobacterium sp.]
MLKHARRQILAGLIAAATVLGFAAPAAQAQIPYLQLPAQQPKYASIVVDAETGEVLYGKRADSSRYPASITKVMTLYLMFEQLAAGQMTLEDRVVFSPRAAAAPPTKLFVKAGDSITVEEAMHALAIRSANDVAVAVAEKLGGSEARFAALMTLRARELGMDSTTFVNASGLPDSRQLSTARDLAVLSRAIMRDFPQYYTLFSTPEFNFRGTQIRGHNSLLRRELGVDGLKTGYTNASGYNIAISGVRQGRRLIVVVLGGASTAARDNHAEDLLLTGFDVANRRDRGERITVGQGYFNQVALPIGIALLVLTGVGPLIAWRKSSPAQLRRRFVGPLVVAAVAAVPLLALTDLRNSPAAAATIIAGVFVTACIT